MNHCERCQAECNRDVMFLLQVKRWQLIGSPDDHFQVDGSVYPNDPCDSPALSWDELANMTICVGNADLPCAIFSWDTEGVWLDREEAESFAKSHEYNYRNGWQVYGIPANGQLAELLRSAPSPAPLQHGEVGK